jgi:hypothetical protein
LIFCVPIPAYLVYNWRLKRSFVIQWREHSHRSVLSQLEKVQGPESAAPSDAIIHAREEGRTLRV